MGSRWWSTTWSAPSDAQNAALAGPPAVATTVAPNALPSSTAADPVPPLAPEHEERLARLQRRSLDQAHPSGVERDVEAGRLGIGHLDGCRQGEVVAGQAGAGEAAVAGRERRHGHHPVADASQGAFADLR